MIIVDRPNADRWNAACSCQYLAPIFSLCGSNPVPMPVISGFNSTPMLPVINGFNPPPMSSLWGHNQEIQSELSVIAAIEAQAFQIMHFCQTPVQVCHSSPSQSD